MNVKYSLFCSMILAIFLTQNGQTRQAKLDFNFGFQIPIDSKGSKIKTYHFSLAFNLNSSRPDMLEMVNNMYSSMENHFYSEIDVVVANQFPTKTRLDEDVIDEDESEEQEEGQPDRNLSDMSVEELRTVLIDDLKLDTKRWPGFIRHVLRSIEVHQQDLDRLISMNIESEKAVEEMLKIVQSKLRKQAEIEASLHNEPITPDIRIEFPKIGAKKLQSMLIRSEKIILEQLETFKNKLTELNQLEHDAIKILEELDIDSEDAQNVMVNVMEKIKKKYANAGQIIL
ncbi:uncharacterized protein LOC141849954 [Brevipalpus obovatus]|uniref:uncharacterized protein LOC141849954 n=1 Tax=Brevipalpus obovatus TaxID=246614 RepID=UPI003D9F4943